MIRFKDVTFEYIRRDEEGNVEGITKALDCFSMHISKGEFVAVLGANGSGKSTMAKHINGLLIPEEGTVTVDGLDTGEEENLLTIRQKAGMVFQNPDNQIIAQTVEEDVAFGPENMGVPTEEMQKRVDEAIERVGLTAEKYNSPNRLSGGQKQRVAIAGVLAMMPECIILDEPTAMLDPAGRREVISTAHELNKQDGITIVLITHYMSEAVGADRIVVMDKGRVVMDGTPCEIFGRVDELKALKLEVPPVTELAYRLRRAGMDMPACVLTEDEFVAAYKKCAEANNRSVSAVQGEASGQNSDMRRLQTGSESANASGDMTGLGLILNNVNYVYNPGTTFERHALKNINLTIPTGQFIGLIGHTGSGKSTLIQHLNGLIRPTDGNVYYNGKDIFDSEYDRRALRAQVGLVFQYPEYQLFEATVSKDVLFGPSNLNMSTLDAEMAAYGALKAVGINEELLDASPFDLSGGQKRRVAIAGVLAMKPKVLALDEPAAGLDPQGRREILDLISKIQREQGITVILVSHSMEDVAEYVERIIVMNDGKVAMDGAPGEVFLQADRLHDMGLDVPEITKLFIRLGTEGYNVPADIFTIDDAEEIILGNA